MTEFYENIFELQMPAHYVCDGSETDGLQETVIDGTTYFFYATGIHSGAIIEFVDGQFFTLDDTMTITESAPYEERSLSAVETLTTLTLQVLALRVRMPGDIFSGHYRLNIKGLRWTLSSPTRLMGPRDCSSD